MTEKQLDFMLDTARGCLRLGGQDIELRPKTFEVLRHLANNAGRLVLKHELYEAVWPNVAVTDDSLVQCIRELREKLGDADHSLIKTVHRRGYRLDVSILPGDVTLNSSMSRFEGSSADKVSAVPPAPEYVPSTSRLDRAEPTIAIIATLRTYRENAPRMAAGFVVVAAIAVIALGLSVWVPWLPARTPVVALAERHATAASFPIPITVRKIATDPGHTGLAEFAHRITDDLTNYLSRVRALQVSASSIDAREALGSADEGGPKTNARYIVHGSARAQGEIIRLNTGLIDAATGVEVWSQHFAADRTAWPTMLDDVLRSLTFSIHVEAFQRGAMQTLQVGDDASADLLLRRAWAHLMTDSRSASFDKAGAAFRAALQRKPESTSAMLGLALYNVLAIADLKLERVPHLAEAEALLRRAHDKDKRNHMVHYGFGALHLLQGNLPAALQAFDRSIEINPSYPPSYARKGRVLLAMQRYQEGLDAIRYALKFNGATTVRGWHLWAGWAELELGRDEEASASLQAAFGALPESPHVRAGLASLHALRGEWADVRRHVLALRRTTPSLSDDQRLRKLNKSIDDKNEASRLRQGLRLALNSQPESH